MLKLTFVTGSLSLALAPLAFVGSMTLPLTAASANPSQDYCEDSGGVYHKDGPNSWCEYPIEKPGHGSGVRIGRSPFFGITVEKAWK